MDMVFEAVGVEVGVAVPDVVDDPGSGDRFVFVQQEVFQDPELLPGERYRPAVEARLPGGQVKSQPAAAEGVARFGKPQPPQRPDAGFQLDRKSVV